MEAAPTLAGHPLGVDHVHDGDDEGGVGGADDGAPVEDLAEGRVAVVEALLALEGGEGPGRSALGAGEG